MQKMMMAAQLMMSQQLSGTTTYRDLGYNWRQEQKQLADEARTREYLELQVLEQTQQVDFPAHS